MNTTQTSSSLAPMKNLAVLAGLLERLEYSGKAVEPGQYRAVVQRLQDEMALADAQTLEGVLAISPAAAEIYENLHYDHAGLCRTPLDLSVAAEVQARAAISAAQRTLAA